MSFRKFPRTSHVEGSKLQHGDDDVPVVPFDELYGKHLVVEEKLDGANVGISFEDGTMKLQSRGHYLRGGPREKQFELLKQWANTHACSLYDILTDRYVMFGEWLYACHTTFYDALPHYFMEFDVYDRQNDTYLSTIARNNLLRNENVGVRIEQVPVIAVGEFDSLAEMTSLIGRSLYVDDGRPSTENASYINSLIESFQTSRGKSASDFPLEFDKFRSLFAKHYVGPSMEGLYIKWEENGLVKGRYKYVRGGFLNHIAGQEEHWHDRPIVKNVLSRDSLKNMFESIG